MFKDVSSESPNNFEVTLVGKVNVLQTRGSLRGEFVEVLYGSVSKSVRTKECYVSHVIFEASE